MTAATNYVRRLRMELDFTQQPLSPPTLPDGYRWIPWTFTALERHAAVKYLSFRHEFDAKLFTSFRSYSNCHRLMRCISRHERFAPQVTWLIARIPFDNWSTNLDCATIQGIVKSRYLGAIQNVGVVPEHRGFGLGRALVLKCLNGFHALGMQRVMLNVTASNEAAVELYRSLGFRPKRTFYHPTADDFDPLSPEINTEESAPVGHEHDLEPAQL
ncbi:GNAT family N-acetyltransferase [Thalassoroseus pseudoceratinae]|uniref:GNAT family N-acetyltransferase n=1 Tax=Thalassoroseus pseudoceratinae TaxID=2713176 RepID=UPI001F0DDC8D|nr:N-acetyltransferase [Thalassoroseus pseudoceratinae]